MTRPLYVLIGGETSGRTRDAFIREGHFAMSCDLLPTDVPGPHYQGDMRDLLGEPWDLAIFHPTCTYLNSAGLHWNRRRPERQALTDESLDFVRFLMSTKIPRWAIENPVGCISTQIRKQDQIIQPYEFGDDASKRTCLWLKGLPPLEKDPKKRVAGRMVEHNGKIVERWANQTDSGQNNLSPSADRWKLRSETYPGIAEAFAKQWGRAAMLDLTIAA